MKVTFTRGDDRRYAVQRDGVLLGYVWRYAGKWDWKVLGAMLTGGHRATRAGASEALAEAYDAAHPSAS